MDRFDELIECDEKELEERFKSKRKRAEKLSESFYRLGLNKRAEFTKDCGTMLSFNHELDGFDNPSKQGKLRRANFCRDKLCPMCNWRRSVKCFHQLSQVLEIIQDDYRFIFLTLTVKNPSGIDLRRTIDRMSDGWHKFTKLKAFKDVVKGYSKTLEITYNKIEDTYHPHYHVLIAVNKSYAKSGRYIKQQEWLQMWRDCFGDQNILFVNVEFVKDKLKREEAVKQFEIEQKKAVGEAAHYGSNITGALLEVTKYSVKDSDYLHNSERITDKVVSVLVSELINVRMISFGGIFKKVRHDLNQDDVENGDLIHVEGEAVNNMTKYLVMTYEWQIGVYQLIDSFVSDHE